MSFRMEACLHHVLVIQQKTNIKIAVKFNQ